jgi:hypothetical protein
MTLKKLYKAFGISQQKGILLRLPGSGCPVSKELRFPFWRLFSLQCFRFDRANRMPYLNAPSACVNIHYGLRW